MHAKLTLVAGLIAGVLLVGCQTSSKLEYKQRTAPTTYNSVTFTDYDLNRNFRGALFGPNKVVRISADKHGIRRTAANTSEVFVVLRNHTDYNSILEARTQFYDQSDVPTDVAPRWQRVVVPANSTSVYRERSTTTAPLKYRVEVRQAK
ncbi:MAG: hypothetical protein R3292_03790 [Alcanivorax sp.]|nr:hypothetical protein [Alcanivorax sp.]